MKVQKIVSLDVETAEIAQNMPNFSLFVRKQLHAAVSEDSITDMQNRIATFNKALKLACAEIIALDPQEDEYATTRIYKQLIDKAREILFQTNLGDY